jgi:hypothetical protein
MLKFYHILPLLLGTQAFASDYQSPRTLALGGAGHAAPLISDAVFLNPSMGSMLPVYSVSGGYLWSDQGRNYSVGIQDSRTELFQAGLAFTRREGFGVVNVGASRGFLERFGVGLGAKFYMPDNGGITQDFSVSGTVLITREATVSFLIDNLVQNSLMRNFGNARDFILGTRLTVFESITLFMDPHYSPDYRLGKKAGARFGAELQVMTDFYLRLGRTLNAPIAYMNARGTGFGFGAGWIGPKIAIDYALHRTMVTDLGQAFTTANTVSTTIFF